mmetsp:Transcript_48588/g.121614  ORF Transcript_48588/g.121614 Transcript_48588/m.121614 type:complete len:262 (-) Transcript_48588:958-1743(-)
MRHAWQDRPGLDGWICMYVEQALTARSISVTSERGREKWTTDARTPRTEGKKRWHSSIHPFIRSSGGGSDEQTTTRTHSPQPSIHPSIHPILCPNGWLSQLDLVIESSCTRSSTAHSLTHSPTHSHSHTHTKSLPAGRWIQPSLGPRGLLLLVRLRPGRQAGGCSGRVGRLHGRLEPLARGHGFDVLQLIVTDGYKNVVQIVDVWSSRLGRAGRLELIEQIKVTPIVVLQSYSRGRQPFESVFVLFDELGVRVSSVPLDQL